ncbi:MAG TPA: NUDIX domain-containing protein [Patescibacteria group bacterium]|nr:NUDIX domain-containing protein [Patescibacteria group bacterium]
MIKHHESTQNIRVAVDAAIVRIKDGSLSVLLIQMKKSPFEGMWAVPGGLLEEEETTLSAATRILKTQTGVTDVFLEQLATFDSVDRDPAGRVVSVAYYALLPDVEVQLKTTEKYADVRWWPIKKLPTLAYDHKTLVREAMERIAAKIQYTNIVWSLLPKEFTLTELQYVYELILGKDLDKRNFRKRIEDLELIKPTGKARTGLAHRPAALYEFKHRKLEYVQVM